MKKYMHLLSFSFLLFFFKANAYDVAIAKIGMKNQIPLCYELAQKIILNKNVMPVEKACANHSTSNMLHQVEFESRFVYQSHVITIGILNEVSEVIDQTKTFMMKSLYDVENCNRDFKKSCISQKYLYKRGIQEFVFRLKNIRAGIFLKANMCPNGEVGCAPLVVSDPYLGDVSVKTLISGDDLSALKVVIKKIDLQIVDLERRSK